MKEKCCKFFYEIQGNREPESLHCKHVCKNFHVSLLNVNTFPCV